MEKGDLNILTGILTFVLLMIPFGLIWFALYRRFKKQIKTFLSYCVLISLTLDVLTAYLSLTAHIGLAISDSGMRTFNHSRDLLGILIWGTSATAIYITMLPAFIITLLTIILVTRYFIKRQKTVDT